MAPHSLVQDYLNRTENLWGIVTNGLTLRLLRNCTFVRRQAYVEFDLAGMLEEQRFQDFAALYRLLHRTRLPRGVEDARRLPARTSTMPIRSSRAGEFASTCATASSNALTMLANGFLRHPRQRRAAAAAIAPACTDIRSDHCREPVPPAPRSSFTGSSSCSFLRTGACSAPSRSTASITASPASAACSTTVAAFTDHDDLWQSLRVLWYVLAIDQSATGIRQPADGVRARAAGAQRRPVRHPGDRRLHHRQPRPARRRSGGWPGTRKAAPAVPRRVNYAALDVEELGSVYESLLEFHPAVDDGLHAVGPASASSPAPSARPPAPTTRRRSWWASSIKSALDPVMADRLSSLKGERSEAKGDYCRSASAIRLAVRGTSCWPRPGAWDEELARVDTRRGRARTRAGPRGDPRGGLPLHLRRGQEPARRGPLPRRPLAGEPHRRQAADVPRPSDPAAATRWLACSIWPFSRLASRTRPSTRSKATIRPTARELARRNREERSADQRPSRGGIPTSCCNDFNRQCPRS